jgi:hypothetical protein
VSGTVRLSGFQSGQNYLVQWWDPYALEPGHQVLHQEIIMAQADNTITLNINKLNTDLAVMIQADQR